MPPELHAAKSMADYYGLLAFGVVALLVIIAVISAVWARVFRPDLAIRLKIEEEQTKQTLNMKVTAESQERTSATMAQTSRFVERMLAKCIPNLEPDSPDPRPTGNSEGRRG
jgi:hypothetical protein